MGDNIDKECDLLGNQGVAFQGGLAFLSFLVLVGTSLYLIYFLSSKSKDTERSLRDLGKFGSW